jgi:hypothetical protein
MSLADISSPAFKPTTTVSSKDTASDAWTDGAYDLTELQSASGADTSFDETELDAVLKKMGFSDKAEIETLKEYLLAGEKTISANKLLEKLDSDSDKKIEKDETVVMHTVLKDINSSTNTDKGSIFSSFMSKDSVVDIMAKVFDTNAETGKITVLSDKLNTLLERYKEATGTEKADLKLMLQAISTIIKENNLDSSQTIENVLSGNTDESKPKTDKPKTDKPETNKPETNNLDGDTDFTTKLKSKTDVAVSDIQLFLKDATIAGIKAILTGNDASDAEKKMIIQNMSDKQVKEYLSGTRLSEDERKQFTARRGTRITTDDAKTDAAKESDKPQILIDIKGDKEITKDDVTKFLRTATSAQITEFLQNADKTEKDLLLKEMKSEQIEKYLGDSDVSNKNKQVFMNAMTPTQQKLFLKDADADAIKLFVEKDGLTDEPKVQANILLVMGSYDDLPKPPTGTTLKDIASSMASIYVMSATGSATGDREKGDASNDIIGILDDKQMLEVFIQNGITQNSTKDDLKKSMTGGILSNMNVYTYLSGGTTDAEKEQRLKDVLDILGIKDDTTKTDDKFDKAFDSLKSKSTDEMVAILSDGGINITNRTVLSGVDDSLAESTKTYTITKDKDGILQYDEDGKGEGFAQAPMVENHMKIILSNSDGSVNSAALVKLLNTAGVNDTNGDDLKVSSALIYKLAKMPVADVITTLTKSVTVPGDGGANPVAKPDFAPANIAANAIAFMNGVDIQHSMGAGINFKDAVESTFTEDKMIQWLSTSEGTTDVYSLLNLLSALGIKDGEKALTISSPLVMKLANLEPKDLVELLSTDTTPADGKDTKGFAKASMETNIKAYIKTINI